MRIGLAVYGDLETVTGGNLYDRFLVEYLRGRRHHVEVLSLPRPGYVGCLAHNLSPALRRRLAGEGLDLLLQDELAHASLLRLNRRPRRPPVVSIVHHLRSSEPHPFPARALYRAVERLYLASVDGFVFNSSITRDTVESLSGRSLPHVVATPGGDRLGPGLDAAQIERRAYEAGPLRALFVGNLIPRKGLGTLLAALRGLAGRRVRLDVVGGASLDPAHARALEQEASSLPAEMVTFRGAVSDEALAERLASSQLLVVPSSWEGFGIVYLEAMAFGLPVIATTAGGAREIVDPGRNGALLPPGDATALAQLLASLSEDRTRLATWSLEALETFRRSPTWSESCSRIESFLRSLLPAAGGGGVCESHG